MFTKHLKELAVKGSRTLATYTPDTLRSVTLMDKHNTARLMRTLASHVVEAQAPLFGLNPVPINAVHQATEGSLSVVEALKATEQPAQLLGQQDLYVQDMLNASWKV